MTSNAVADARLAESEAIDRIEAWAHRDLNINGSPQARLRAHVGANTIGQVILQGLRYGKPD